MLSLRAPSGIASPHTAHDRRADQFGSPAGGQGERGIEKQRYECSDPDDRPTGRPPIEQPAREREVGARHDQQRADGADRHDGKKLRGRIRKAERQHQQQASSRTCRSRPVGPMSSSAMASSTFVLTSGGCSLRSCESCGRGDACSSPTSRAASPCRKRRSATSTSGPIELKSASGKSQYVLYGFCAELKRGRGAAGMGERLGGAG